MVDHGSLWSTVVNFVREIYHSAEFTPEIEWKIGIESSMLSGGCKAGLVGSEELLTVVGIDKIRQVLGTFGRRGVDGIVMVPIDVSPVTAD